MLLNLRAENSTGFKQSQAQKLLSSSVRLHPTYSLGKLQAQYQECEEFCSRTWALSSLLPFFHRRNCICKLFFGGLIHWGLYWDMKEKEHNPGFSGKQVTSGEKALIHIGLCILYSPILALKVKVSVTLIFDFNFWSRCFKLYVSHDLLHSSISLFTADSKVHQWF